MITQLPILKAIKVRITFYISYDIGDKMHKESPKKSVRKNNILWQEVSTNLTHTVDISDIKITDQGFTNNGICKDTLSLANPSFVNLLISTVDGYLNAKADLVDSDFLVR